MEVRKNAAKKYQELNKKFIIRALPFPKRTWETLKDHKKKTVLFLVMGGLMIYYETYLKIIKYFRTMEPLQLKLRRWFLGEERIMPDSIKEIFIEAEGLRLKPETITILSEKFIQADKEFINGVTRKFLKKVYKTAGYLPTQKDQEEFYNEGPYRRKLNQRLCGLSLKQFLMQFDGLLKRIQKNDPTFKEEDLLRQVLNVWDESKAKTHEWESNMRKIWTELKKSKTMFEEDKQKIVTRKLKENPNSSIEEIEKELAKAGFHGMGLKDKLMLTEYQLMYLEVTKSHYMERLKSEVIASKNMKIQSKIKNLEDEIEKMKATKQQYQTRFKEIYQKHMTEENKEGAENPEAQKN